MTGEDVRRLVEREIAGNWQLTNAHGCDLRRCCVPPELREYDDRGGHPHSDPPPIVSLWLVLEEVPGDSDCYKIVYSEHANMFGLAVSGSVRDVFLGYYGSFLDTYRSM